MKQMSSSVTTKALLRLAALLSASAWKVFEIVHTAKFVEEVVLDRTHSPKLASVAGSPWPQFVALGIGMTVILILEVKRWHEERRGAPAPSADLPAPVTRPAGEVLSSGSATPLAQVISEVTRAMPAGATRVTVRYIEIEMEGGVQNHR